MSENTNLHAHVSTFSRDCDGGHGNEYTMGFNDDETGERERAQGVNDFSDIHFMQRVMMNVASPYAVEYGMTVKVDSEGIEVHETTDEGFRGAEVRWCRDEDCDPNAQGPVYDEYAEAMGY
jgi:hypothetical protein